MSFISPIVTFKAFEAVIRRSGDQEVDIRILGYQVNPKNCYSLSDILVPLDPAP
jgi:hypothetical protein